MNDDFELRLIDGHKVVIQPTGYVHLYIDGKYYGFYHSEERAIAVYEQSIKPNLEHS